MPEVGKGNLVIATEISNKLIHNYLTAKANVFHL